MEIIAIFFLGLCVAMWFVWKVVSGLGRKMRTVATGGLYGGRGGSSKFLWLMKRALVAGLASVLWVASTAVRPLIILGCAVLLWKAWRSVTKFMGGLTSLTDAFVVREIEHNLAKTWDAFSATTMVDQRGVYHYPLTTNWRQVFDLDGEPFGWQADLQALQGSSLGAIDDLTAEPGDKDEALASTYNRFQDRSKTLTRLLLDKHLPRFAAVDVQTTLERLQMVQGDEMPALHSGLGVMTMMTTDPLWKPRNLPMPLYDQPWERVALPIPLCIGPDRWGNEVTVLLERLRIMAKSGWGKSVLLDTIIANLAYLPADRVIIILIDCKWGMHHSKWGSCVDWLVTDPNEATECLKTVHDQMEGRADQMKAEGLEKLDEATPGLPAVIIIVDETQDLPRSKDPRVLLAMDYLTKIYQKGRALGFYAIMALQYGTGKDIPRTLSMNVEVEIAGKLRDRSAAQVAMGDDVVSNTFGPHRIVDSPLNKGVFALKNNRGQGMYVRAYYTSPQDKLALADHFGRYNPRPQRPWIPAKVEHVELTEDEADAIDKLCSVLNIKDEAVDLQELPALLDRARGRTKPADLKALTSSLQRLIDAA